jgi:hypothetical protein
MVGSVAEWASLQHFSLIWNLATPYIKGIFDMEVFDIEGFYDIDGIT